MDAEVIASLTTAGGTLVLAVATYFSTRTANRASRVAERALMVGLQPVLTHARLDDPHQKIGFSDERWYHIVGPGAIFDAADDVIYLVLAVRNVGSGIAVIQGWRPWPERTLIATPHPPPVSEFRGQTRDLYIAPGDVGFWQAAFRDPTEPEFDTFLAAAKERRAIMVDLLYSDIHGGQRTVTRFSLLPGADDRWIGTSARHWMLDGVSPR
jgi:hypothetical protein